MPCDRAALQQGGGWSHKNDHQRLLTRIRSVIACEWLCDSLVCATSPASGLSPVEVVPRNRRDLLDPSRQSASPRPGMCLAPLQEQWRESLVYLLRSPSGGIWSFPGVALANHLRFSDGPTYLLLGVYSYNPSSCTRLMTVLILSTFFGSVFNIFQGVIARF